MPKDLTACGFFRDGWAQKVVQTMRRIHPEVLQFAGTGGMSR